MLAFQPADWRGGRLLQEPANHVVDLKVLFIELQFHVWMFPPFGNLFDER